ncbi:hypothetical protein Tco_1576371 [Tanacetum coccineum]
MEADDQAIQTILLGLPEDIYAAVDSCETAQEIWLRVQQMMKGSDIGIQEKKAKLFNEWERFTSTDGESIESYYHRFSKLMNDFKRNKHFPEKIASNLKFLNNLQPEWSRHVTRVHSNKDLNTTDYTQLFAQPGIKMSIMQYRMSRIRLFKMQFRTGCVRIGNGKVVAARAEGTVQSTNGEGMLLNLQTSFVDCSKRRSRNPTPKLKSFLNLKSAAADLDKFRKSMQTSILMAKLPASIDIRVLRRQSSRLLIHNCIPEQYIEILEPIPEPHQVQQNDNVISDISGVEQEGGTVDQHTATVEETRAYFESLYNNLALEVEKVNSVNRKLKETNADLTTELARYKNQEKCFEISQEKYDKLERCYQKSVYQEQCLTKKINALHLSSGKQITTLNEEISNLSKQLSTEKSTVSSLLEEKKKLKSDFKIREDELLDKQIQLENKIKELDNILVKTGQSIQTMHMLSPKPDSFYHTEQKMALGYQNPFYLKQAQRKQQSLYNGKVLLEKHDPPVVHDSEETLQLAQESRQKMKQLNKEIKPANYTKINHLSGVFVSQTAKSQEEVYFESRGKFRHKNQSIR